MSFFSCDLVQTGLVCIHETFGKRNKKSNETTEEMR